MCLSWGCVRHWWWNRNCVWFNWSRWSWSWVSWSGVRNWWRWNWSWVRNWLCQVSYGSWSWISILSRVCLNLSGWNRITLSWSRVRNWRCRLSYWWRSGVSRSGVRNWWSWSRNWCRVSYWSRSWIRISRWSWVWLRMSMAIWLSIWGCWISRVEINGLLLTW